MKVLFQGIRMLFVLQLLFLTGTAYSQDRDSTTVGNHKFLYGIHLGYTENKVDIYSTQDGTLHTSDDYSFYAGGFRIAVIGEAQLGRCFDIRVMPGISFFSGLKLESLRGELPVDVKFHPVRIGKLRPYLTSGIGYDFDFASLRDDGHYNIKPLNTHDLRYTCGLGVDWYTRIVRVGFELKASFGLLPLGTGGGNVSYFHSSPTFCLGLNIEA